MIGCIGRKDAAPGNLNGFGKRMTVNWVWPTLSKTKNRYCRLADKVWRRDSKRFDIWPWNLLEANVVEMTPACLRRLRPSSSILTLVKWKHRSNSYDWDVWWRQHRPYTVYQNLPWMMDGETGSNRPSVLGDSVGILRSWFWFKLLCPNFVRHQYESLNVFIPFFFLPCLFICAVRIGFSWNHDLSSWKNLCHNRTLYIKIINKLVRYWGM